jgi:flagellar assembly protein FliH
VDCTGTGPLRIQLREVEAGAFPDNERAGTVDEARHLAAQILKEAEENAVAVRERAFQEGLKEGLEKGRRKAEEAMSEMVQKTKDVLMEAEAERAALFNSTEREIVELALEIAKRVVAAELKVNPDVVVAIAKEALVLVRDRPHMLVLVHPDDLETCNQARQRFEVLLPDAGALRVLPDIRIERGGCLIDTGQGVVDATLGSRWAEVIESMKG